MHLSNGVVMDGGMQVDFRLRPDRAATGRRWPTLNVADPRPYTSVRLSDVFLDSVHCEVGFSVFVIPPCFASLIVL